MTNNFNFQPDIERADPPAFAPTHCGTCGRVMKLNCEASSFGPGGRQCDRCSAALMRSVPASNIYKTDATAL